jgi:hypothetical protein
MFVLRRVGVRSPDLYKAFRTNRLIATPSLVEVGRIIYKADWTFCGVLV